MTTVERAESRSAPGFILAIGFLCGVLVAALVAADSDGGGTAGGAPSAVSSTGGASGAGASSGDGATGLGTDGAGSADVGAVGQVDGSTGGALGEAVPAGSGSAAPSGDPSAPGAGDAAAPTQNGTTAGAAPVSNARGVTPTSVKVGVAFPDLAAFNAINPKWQSGDFEEQYAAALDMYRREGLLPAHGRDVELVFYEFDQLNESDQRTACVNLVKEQGVFAGLWASTYGTGLPCMAQEFRTPVLANSQIYETQMQQIMPYGFTMTVTVERMFRNWIRWADARRILQGKTLGLYYVQNAGTPDMGPVLQRELEAMGYKLAVKMKTTNGYGGPDDSVAVQQFRTAGVEVAILPVSTLNTQNFLDQAESQGYRPQYIQTDLLYSTDDSIASSFNEKQYDGTYGMSSYHTGEVGSGTYAPETQKCLDNYERFSGKKIARDTSEVRFVEGACDLVKILVLGLNGAGPGLDAAGFIRAVESLRDVPMARVDSVTFGPDKHQGVSRQRTIRWHASCICWKLVDGLEFQPLWVP